MLSWADLRFLPGTKHHREHPDGPTPINVVSPWLGRSDQDLPIWADGDIIGYDRSSHICSSLRFAQCNIILTKSLAPYKTVEEERYQTGRRAVQGPANAGCSNCFR
jgi:hypothetical protein